MKPTFALAVLVALSPAVQAEDTWIIDKVHSEASFQVRHFVTHVRGRFADFGGTIVTDAAKPESSSVEFKIVTASIDTAMADRDKHLRSADFFDAEKFPEISFKSKSIKKTGADAFDVTGTLTMRGVSKEVTLPVKFLGSLGDKAGFELATTLNRKDYGVNWNKALDQGGFVLGDDVKVQVSLEVNRKKAEAPAAK